MNKKRLGKRIAEGIICLAIMLTIVNLPVFTNEVNAAEYSYIVSGTKQQYIDSIFLSYNWSSNGYSTKLSSDEHRGSLNRYSRADNIYLDVFFTDDADMAITKIWIKEDNSLTTIDDYEVILVKDGVVGSWNSNVNKEGKASYIYYTKDKNAGDPIASIGVWQDGDDYFEYVTNAGQELLEYKNSDFDKQYYNYGYTLVGGDHNDLNAGAGSGTAYVYLYYKRAPYVKSSDTSICVDGKAHNGNVITTNGASISFGASVSAIGVHSQTYTVSKTGLLSISGTTKIEIKAHDFTGQPYLYDNAGRKYQTCRVCGADSEHVSVEAPVLFRIIDGTAQVYGLDPNIDITGDLVIPDTVMFEGTSYTVTGIAGSAFSESNFAGNLVIPDSVTWIGSYAFKNCNFTGKLIIGNGVKAIDDYAFYKCNFAGDLIIPDSVTTIGVMAFYNSSVTGKLTIGNGVTTIDFKAFENCNFTGDLIIPDSVTTIGMQAFKDCGFNGKLTLGNGVTTIDDKAFENCNFTGDLIIPDSVTTIGMQAFMNCGFNGKLTLGNGVTTIGTYAFNECGFTDGLIIPDSVTTIGYSAFYNSGFTGRLALGNNVITIDELAFAGCGFIGDLVIPDSVTLIGEYAFCNSGFTGGLTLGNSVNTIDKYVFEGCGFTGDLIIPNSVTTIGDYAFHDCKSITGLTIANGVTTISGHAFYNCVGITGTVSIPDSVNTFGDYILGNCISITSVSVPCSFKSTIYLGAEVIGKIVKRGHNFVLSSDDSSMHICSVCNASGNHDFSTSPDKCSICGFYADLIGAKLAGYSLSLHDNIGVDFYMELADSVMKDEGAKFIVKLEGDSLAEIPVSEAQTTTVNGNTYYVFECRVAAAQMTGCISAKIVLGDGTEGTEYQFTVQDYAKYILEHEAEYEEVVPVVKAMLRYGASAQNYFGHNTDKMADEILSEADRTAALTTPELTTYNYSAPEATDTISFLGTSLLLESEVSLKCYFYTTVDLQDSNVIVKYGDKVLDTSDYRIGKNGNVQYVTVTGLTPADYGKQFTIAVQDITVENVSAYGYMSQAFKQMGDSDRLIDLLKNMYAYGEAYKKCYKLL